MDNKLFIEELEVKIISILQDKLLDNTITLQRAGEISNIALSYLYPTMEKDHLLLTKEVFANISELKSIADEIDIHISQLS